MTTIARTHWFPNRPTYLRVTLDDGRVFTASLHVDGRHTVNRQRKGKFGNDYWAKLPEGRLRDEIIALAAEHVARDPDVPAAEQAGWAGVAFAHMTA